MTALLQARNAVKKIPLLKNRTYHASDLSAIRWDLKIPVKSNAIMFSNDRHSPNRDFVYNNILIICKPGYGLSNSMGGLTELFWCVGGH